MNSREHRSRQGLQQSQFSCNNVEQLVQSLSPLSVLVVEDEPLIRCTTVDALEMEGYEVFEAASADEALSLMQNHPQISLIFTDIDMPGSMDGVKLAGFVRDRWPPIKIIVTSGRMSPASRDLPRGVPFMPKPYDYEKLVGSIRELTLA